MTTSDWLIIITACLTGVATLITAYAGLVKTKRDTRAEADEECQRKLAQARAEAEHMADELHELRMRKGA